MIRLFIHLIVLLCMSTIPMKALTSKRSPASDGSDPVCNPGVDDIIIAVAGPRECYCSETSTGGIGSATTIWPPRLYDIIFYFAVQYQCNPEQYNSTTSICTRRSECASDASYQVPGWIFYVITGGYPVFTIEAGPGSTP